MVLNPTVLARARAELDAVVGRDRLPTLADRDHLPYISAICREVLRWNPVTPTGAPRRSVDDDEYGGCLIPAGCTLIYNAWSV